MNKEIIDLKVRIAKLEARITDQDMNNHFRFASIQKELEKREGPNLTDNESKEIEALRKRINSISESLSTHNDQHHYRFQEIESDIRDIRKKGLEIEYDFLPMIKKCYRLAQIALGIIIATNLNNELFVLGCFVGFIIWFFRLILS